MIRSLKALGLALVAVLAMGALVASPASAAPKLTPVPEEYPVTVTGEQTTANVFELEGTRSTQCTFVLLEGKTENKAEAAASKLTTKPTYAECTTTILGNVDRATVTMNECDYLLTTTETTAGAIAAEGWEVTGKENHIQCPTGHEIEIHVYASEAKDVANEPLCTYKIAPQTPAGDLDYKLTAKVLVPEGKFIWEAGRPEDIKSTLTGIAVTKTTGTVTNCGAAAQMGALKGEANMKWGGPLGLLEGRFED